jgi:CTP synthase
VPGGFGERGSEGKIASVRFARERGVPFFGICLGMQMACIEGARNTAGIAEASSTEFGPTKEPVVGIITEWMTAEGLKSAKPAAIWAAPCAWAPMKRTWRATAMSSIYDATTISERHRHRYEVNVAYREALEQGGLRFRACRPTACCPKSSSVPIIRSSSACSSTPNSRAARSIRIRCSRALSLLR